MKIQKALHRVRPYDGVDVKYILYNLWRDATSGALAAYFTGATIKHFTGNALSRYSIPLPPKKEQERIVLKVEQLFAICDDLETKLNQSRSESEKLMEAVMGELVG